MKISIQWLREWVDPSVDNQILADQLTMAGHEVESIIPVAADFSGVISAEVQNIKVHPDSSSLKHCKVNAGDDGVLDIICGANNVRKGMRVALAKVGARLANNVIIEETNIRGMSSCGMLCSVVELGLAEEAEGLLELPDNLPVGQDLREFISAIDEIFDISLTPNRGDCFSVNGIAREIAVLNKCTLEIPKIKAVNATISSERKVRLDAAQACPHYVGRKIQGIDVNRAVPLWLVERLHRSGLRTINPVVDITNYVMLELGQPMHAFDDDILHGCIHVRYAKHDEHLLLLDGQKISLNETDLVIADDRQVLAMAGVMGGITSAVSGKSGTIFLESAYFDPWAVSDQARRYGLHTDSSHRFERGVDYMLQRTAIERATQLILESCGGDAGPVIEESSAKYMPARKEIVLQHTEITRLLGVEVSNEDVNGILLSLGMQVKQGKQGWSVTPPSYRFDIEIKADLVEEIARIYGYDHIPEQRPQAEMLFHERHSLHDAMRKACTVLVDRGYQEAITYSFVDKSLQDLLNPDVDGLQLSNPIAADMSVLRTSLWPGLIRALQFNINRQQQRVRLFETGLIFKQESREILQTPAIGGLIYGNIFNNQWDSKDIKSDYFDIKGDVEEILSRNRIPVTEAIFRKTSHRALHPGQSAEIIFENQIVGFLGALHPAVQQLLGLVHSIYIFELYFECISQRKTAKFRKLSKFPVVKRDLAVVVDENITADQVLNCIRQIAPDSLINLQLFDVYRGEGIDLGKKSLALDLTFQRSSSTLTDEEVDTTLGEILSRLNSKLGGALRE
jgi:phenylalanyl-tRNA synthetase beta chain